MGVYRLYREKILMKFLRTGCRFFSNWPMNPSTGKYRFALFKTVYWIHFINEIYGTLGIMNGICCCFITVSGFVKSFVERLVIEMEQFFEISDRGYFDQLSVVYYTLTISFITGGFLFAFSPLFTEGHLTPLNTVYILIPREKYWGICVTYALNILHIVNAASVIFLDLLIVSILWHVSCKFSLLKAKLNITSEESLKMWIREHQDTISHAYEVNSIMAPLAVKSTIVVVLYMTTSGLVITYKVPVVELTKFLLVTIFSVLRFLACNWAANAMTEKAHHIAWVIYGIPWIDAKLNTRKDILVIIQRCQKPITIHSAGFITAWSLKFCGQVLYRIFTFFSALRAALHK